MSTNKIKALCLLDAVIASAHISSAFWLGTYTNRYLVLIGFYSWFFWLIYLLPNKLFRTAIVGLVILSPSLPLTLMFTSWCSAGLAP